jgi:hypothetical protein
MARKESGKRSSDYCRDHGLDAGQLRSWTSKLGLLEIRVAVTDPVFEKMMKEGRAQQVNAVLSYKLA